MGESAAGPMAIVSSSRPSRSASSSDLSETESSSGDAIPSRGGASSRCDAGSSSGAFSRGGAFSCGPELASLDDPSPQETRLRSSCAAAMKSW